MAAFIRLVCHTPELQFYTAHRLYTALSADLSQETLTLAAVWIIGEFADVLLQGGSMEDGEEVKQVHRSPYLHLLVKLIRLGYRYIPCRSIRNGPPLPIYKYPHSSIRLDGLSKTFSQVVRDVNFVRNDRTRSNL